MTISKLIAVLEETKRINGDMEVNLCTDGVIYTELDFNCPDADSPMYIEGYHLWEE